MADEELMDRQDESEEVPVWAAKFMDSINKRLEGLEKAEEEETKRPVEAADKKDRKDADDGEDEKENTDGEKRKDESEKEEAHKAAEELDKRKKEEERKDESEAKREEDWKEGAAKAREKKAEEEREDRARKDAQVARENREMKAQIAEMEARLGRLYAEPSFDDRNALAEARARADGVYQAVTGRPASEPLPGESPISYRKRMADGLRRFSNKFKEERVDSLSGSAFDVIEQQIYADAQAASKTPDILGPGQLRAVTRMDRGREVTEYIGDPLATWGPFMGTGAKVAFNRKTH